MDTSKNTLNLDVLTFDPQNPRLPRRLAGVTNEIELIDYFLRDESLLELMRSIAEIGYSAAEPLLVVPNIDIASQTYTVVEGNRRLAALKLLKNPELAKVRSASVQEIVDEQQYSPVNIPVIVYNSRVDILDYLGYRHITGVKDWGPLEKAVYLDQLYKRHIEQIGPAKIYKSLAKMVGSRADYTERLHLTLNLYRFASEKAYFSLDIEEKDIDFSWLYTCLLYKEIVTFLKQDNYDKINSDLSGLNPDNFEQLYKWLYDPKNKSITESRQISQISQIVAYPTAVEKLKQGVPISEALLYTSAPSDAFDTYLKRSRDALISAKNSIEQLGGIPEGAFDLLKEIEKYVKSIKGALTENFLSETVASSNLDNPELIKLIKSLIPPKED